METVRDLGRAELWHESLERSRARRERAGRPPKSTRSMKPVAGFSGISAIALLAVTLPNLLGGHRASQQQAQVAFRVNGRAQSGSGLQPRPAARLVSAPAHRPSRRTSTATRSTPAAPAPVLVASTSAPAAPVTHTATVTHTAATVSTHTTAKVTTHPSVRHHPSSPPAHTAATSTAPQQQARPDRPPTPPAPASPGYVNPLAHASVTAERIDQGVDYSGSGTLGAIGAASITYVGTSNTGWPGAFIEFRLLDGPDRGRYVYYAESVVPASGLHVGQMVHAGQAIATITGGIEIGWGANIGTETYAAAMGQWSNGSDSGNVATPAGRSFSALISSLGGPAGLVEG